MNRPNHASNSRAEQVRQRRQQKSGPGQSAVRRTGTSKTPALTRTYETNVPPVVVRGHSGSPVLQRTPVRRQRRQIAIPLRHSGAEVVVPGLPMLQFGTKWISGTLAVLFSILLLYMISASPFEVSQLEVQGLSRLAPADLETALRVNGESIFTIQPAELQKQVETTFPELKNVQVEVGLPASVTITAEEREPVILWRSSEQTYWSDNEGILFTPKGEQPAALLTVDVDGELPIVPLEAALPEDADLLTVQALTTQPQKIDLAALTSAQQLAPHIPEGAALAYSAENGLGWVDPQGWRVYVGMDAADLNEKMIVYEAILAKINPQEQHFTVISVAHLNAPFYRLEP